MGPVRDALAARRVADRYVTVRYPLAADRARPDVHQADEGFGQTWTVAYPFHDRHLPGMSLLTATINGSGRLLSVHLPAMPPGAESDSEKTKSGDGRGLCG
jgi:hypothetical protein